MKGGVTMSDEERKQILKDALSGAKDVPTSAPRQVTPRQVTAVPAGTPCCVHCSLKATTSAPYPPIQPANPYGGGQAYPNTPWIITNPTSGPQWGGEYANPGGLSIPMQWPNRIISN